MNTQEAIVTCVCVVSFFSFICYAISRAFGRRQPNVTPGVTTPKTTTPKGKQVKYPLVDNRPQVSVVDMYPTDLVIMTYDGDSEGVSEMVAGWRAAGDCGITLTTRKPVSVTVLRHAELELEEEEDGGEEDELDPPVVEEEPKKAEPAVIYA